MRDTPRERPSATAITVALALLALRRRRDGAELVANEDARAISHALRRLGGVPWLLARAAAWRVAVPVIRIIEWCTVPGIIRHFGVRKRLIEEIVTQSIEHGTRRVIVLGAGLDLLTFRLASRFPGVSLVEVDHPATLPTKRAMLGARADRITLVAADLGAADTSSALQQLCSDGAPAIAGAEGLTMYLEEAQLTALLKGLARLPGVARLVFTFLEPGKDGRAAFPRQRRALTWFLHRTREPFRWGIAPTDLDSLLAPLGWQARRIIGRAEFGEGFTGESIADCERR